MMVYRGRHSLLSVTMGERKLTADARFVESLVREYEFIKQIIFFFLRRLSKANTKTFEEHVSTSTLSYTKRL